MNIVLVGLLLVIFVYLVSVVVSDEIIVFKFVFVVIIVLFVLLRVVGLIVNGVISL